LKIIARSPMEFDSGVVLGTIYIYDMSEDEYRAVYHEVMMTKEAFDIDREFDERRKRFYGKEKKD